MQKTFRNDVSHVKFEQTTQKLYKDICGGHLGFSLFVHFLRSICKVTYLGCVLGYIYILKHASDIQLQWMWMFDFVFQTRAQNAAFVVVFLNAHKKNCSNNLFI